MIRHIAWAVVVGLLGVVACANVDDSAETQLGATSKALAGQPQNPQVRGSVPPGQVEAGRALFNRPLQHTNGRTCGTCHVEATALALSPADVQARFASNPSDPLFHPIDADDPNASTLTFENLKRGLVRVKLRLPDNVDLIQIPPEWTAFVPGAAVAWYAQNVVPGSRIGDALPAAKLPEIITPADRMIEVWRAVPGVKNTDFSGPFLYDGRGDSLEAQALGALDAHSQLSGAVGEGQLRLIAQYERSLFSSGRAQLVSQQLRAGVPLDDIEKPEDTDPAFDVGRAEYERFCTACHGKATDDRVENESVRAGAFFQVDSDGNVVWQIIPGVGPVPVAASSPGNEFLNIGATFITYLGQVTKNSPPQFQFPTFTSSINLPRYRLRFYTDATRTQKITDLPPLPRPSAQSPFVAERTPQGVPIFGPNFGPQLWSTDPGRALITGNHLEFEAFNIPQLRGIAETAPYFHDNSSPTLESVVDIYSLFILPFFPPLNPTGAQAGEHAMSAQQRADLVEFLRKF